MLKSGRERLTASNGPLLSTSFSATRPTDFVLIRGKSFLARLNAFVLAVFTWFPCKLAQVTLRSDVLGFSYTPAPFQS